MSNQYIVQSDMDEILSNTDGNINIISGRHGDWQDSLVLEPEFYFADVKKYGGLENVNVFNFSELSVEEIQSLINSGDTTILGWCFSEYYEIMRTLFK